MIDQLMSGSRGLAIAYLLVLVPMLMTLISRRAPWTKFFTAPLLAFGMMLVALLLVGILQLVPILGSRHWLLFIVGGSAMVLLGHSLGVVVAEGDSSGNSVHRRGAIVRALTFMRTGGNRGKADVTVAGVPVPLADETKHFKFIGTTGTGKSTAICELLTTALARGDRAVIADPDGGYLDRFYDAARGDVILNPFDKAARKWDLFGEISNPGDVEQIARALIPHGGDTDRIWYEYARTFFTQVVRQSMKMDMHHDRELLRLVTSALPNELRVLLAGTPASPFLEEGNERMFGSLRSVASSAVGALEYTICQNAPPLSVREWVRQGAKPDAARPGGVLFLPYKASEIAALHSVISAWMRLAIFEAMDQPAGDQRLWFVIDELDALGEIDGLKDALARLRKFGGRCVLGFQSIAQVSGTYGRGTAETIVENCGNTLILRCSASERGGTAEFASKLIGQREVMHTTESVTRRSGEWRTNTSTSQQLKIEPAVMASEIERLPDLAGFLKVASCPDWQMVQLTPPGDTPASRRPRPIIDDQPVRGTVPVLGPASSQVKFAAPAKRARSRKCEPLESAAKYAIKRKPRSAGTDVVKRMESIEAGPLEDLPPPVSAPPAAAAGQSAVGRAESPR